MSRFDLREIEYAVEQAEQALGGTLDRHQVIRIHRIKISATEQFREPENGIHRRTDFVTDVREEA